MTGFKLHCPPGFVDRAYLVFLVADTTHRTADYDGSESLSPPPSRSGDGIRLHGRCTSPWAPHAPASINSPSLQGISLGGQWRRRWECVIVSPTARGFRPRPPGGACPFSLSQASRACTPYPRDLESRTHATVTAASCRADVGSARHLRADSCREATVGVCRLDRAPTG